MAGFLYLVSACEIIMSHRLVSIRYSSFLPHEDQTNVNIGVNKNYLYSLLNNCCNIKKRVQTNLLYICSACTLSTFHVLTPNPPVILSANDTLQVAPYHTHYPKLEDHMTDVGLGKYNTVVQ